MTTKPEAMEQRAREYALLPYEGGNGRQINGHSYAGYLAGAEAEVAAYRERLLKQAKHLSLALHYDIQRVMDSMEDKESK